MFLSALTLTALAIAAALLLSTESPVRPELLHPALMTPVR